MKTERELRAHHLYKFLYKHNVLYSYVDNIANLKYNSTKRTIARDFLCGKSSLLSLLNECGNIDHSFTWAETPEGHDFWSKLHYKQVDGFSKLWKHCKIFDE
jgi:hypothetical protein